MSVRNLASYDFSTLYTKITHESLLKEIKWVIRKAFEASGKARLAIYAK